MEPQRQYLILLLNMLSHSVLVLLILLSILLLLVKGNLDRENKQNQISVFPLGVTLEDESGVLYQFNQDTNESLFLRIASKLPHYLNPSGLNKTACVVLKVFKLADRRYKMMNGDAYSVSNDRQINVWKLIREQTYDLSPQEIILKLSSMHVACVEAL